MHPQSSQRLGARNQVSLRGGGLDILKFQEPQQGGLNADGFTIQTSRTGGGSKNAAPLGRVFTIGEGLQGNMRLGDLGLPLGAAKKDITVSP